MKLPILLPDLPTQRFDCHGCTNCCRELVVHLTVEDRRKIDRQGWADRLESPAYVRLGRDHVLNHKSTGGCVFLQDDGKCRIHVEFGGSEKPLACQLYPFTLEADEGGLRAGIRFDCPTVARSAGVALPAHASNLLNLGNRFLREMPSSSVSSLGINLTADRMLTAQELEALIRGLDGWIGQTGRPLIDRIAGVATLLQTLAATKLHPVRDERFCELVRILIADLSHERGGQEVVPPPDERQRKLLRQAVFAHCENITLKQARASFASSIAYRWKQLLRSRELVNATGDIPDLAGRTPKKRISVDTLETVTPGVPPGEGDGLLTRYLRARIQCRSAFGPAYYGWSMLDGLSSLLLATAAVGWLARYFAAGDARITFGLDDVRRAIGVIDRAAGRARELGARSARLRVAYLSRNQGLLRLLHAYSIIPVETRSPEAIA